MKKYLLLNFTILFTSIPVFSQWSQITDITSREDNYKMHMSLSKYTYKEFEPVIAKFDILNLDSEPLILDGGMFDEVSDRTVIISDSLGKTWDFNKMTVSVYSIYPESLYVVQPGDTFTISLVINNWGEAIKAKNYKEWLFGQFGYFPAGKKYKVKYNSYGKISNEVEFEIDSLNEEDKKVLEAYNSVQTVANLDSIIKNYPQNVFLEHIIKKRLMQKYFDILKGKTVPDELESEFEDFFKTYPNTYYLYNDKFMSRYYVKVFFGKNYKTELDKLINKNLSKELNRFLSKRNTLKRIEKALRYHLKKIKKS